MSTSLAKVVHWKMIILNAIYMGIFYKIMCDFFFCDSNSALL